MLKKLNVFPRKGKEWDKKKHIFFEARFSSNSSLLFFAEVYRISFTFSFQLCFERIFSENILFSLETQKAQLRHVTLSKPSFSKAKKEKCWHDNSPPFECKISCFFYSRSIQLLRVEYFSSINWHWLVPSNSHAWWTWEADGKCGSGKRSFWNGSKAHVSVFFYFSITILLTRCNDWQCAAYAWRRHWLLLVVVTSLRCV